jgi:hypothetical protein
MLISEVKEFSRLPSTCLLCTGFVRDSVAAAKGGRLPLVDDAVSRNSIGGDGRSVRMDDDLEDGGPSLSPIAFSRNSIVEDGG